MLTHLRKEVSSVKAIIHEYIDFQENCEIEEISDFHFGENGVIQNCFRSMKVPDLSDH